MTLSMTGYGSGSGSFEGWNWNWDMRSVNGRGLDMRLRIPDWLDGLEPKLRQAVKGKVARGNVTLTLRLSRDAGAGGPDIDSAALTASLIALKRIEVEAAEAHALPLAPSRASDILALCRATGPAELGEEETAELVAALAADVAGVIDSFNAARAEEGARLNEVLADQVARIAELVEQAADAVANRQTETAEKLRQNLARVLDNADGADPDRVAQELALIAVKADVTEELDRLAAHVASARDLLAGQGPVGRKLDFLTQEFNREANTLCAKAQSRTLTQIGLDLKAVIDQMREQVQNVE